MAGKLDLGVSIIGGGLGGLCLAQGLTRAGIACTVFERDADAGARVQGYRLSITPDGFEALRRNLSDPLWRRVEAATAPLRDGMSLVTEELEELMFIKAPEPEDAVRRHGSINRVTLREILLADLGDRVRFGKRFSRYELLPDQRVRSWFEDGGSSDGDLLVGADGVSSRVQAQFLPGATRADTGVCAISGKTPFRGAVAAAFAAAPIGESAVVIAREPHGMFVAKHELDGDVGAYLFWSFGGARERFPGDLDARSPAELTQLARQMMRGWHPLLNQVVEYADHATVRVLRFRASPRVRAWASGPVTLLGDAIHSMPPSGGLGANTALRDASVLSAALTDYVKGDSSLSDAVARYEKQMFRYAFSAIDESMNNLRRMANENRFTRRAGRIGAKLAGRVMGMRRKASAKP